MTLDTQYEFFLHLQEGTIPIIPDNSKLEWEYVKNKTLDNFDLVLNTELIISGRGYEELYKHERERLGTCAEFIIEINSLCTTTLQYQGRFTVEDCNFNPEKCWVRVKIEPLNHTNCFLKHWDEKINLLDSEIPLAPNLAPVQTHGTMEYYYDNGFIQSNVPDLAVSEEIRTEFSWRAFKTLNDFLAVIVEDNGVIIDPGSPVINGMIKVTDPPPTNVGWQLIEIGGRLLYGYPWDEDGPGGYPEEFSSWDFAFTYVREVSDDDSDDNGNAWIDIGGGDYARKPMCTLVSPWKKERQTRYGAKYTRGEIFSWLNDNVPDIVTVREVNPYYVSLNYVTSANDFPSKRGPRDTVDVYHNSRYVNDILSYFFPKVCTGTDSVIRSHFLSLNIDGGDPFTRPVNDPYDQALLEVTKLILTPIHDMIRLDETESSFRIEEFSFKNLIEDLINTFNLTLLYNPGNDSYYLEHFSFSSARSERRMSLITAENEHWIQGKWEYGYTTEQVPIEEIFIWPVSSTPDSIEINDDPVVGPDVGSELKRTFDGYPISYADCTDKDSPEEVRSISVFITDIGLALYNGFDIMHPVLAGGDPKYNGLYLSFRQILIFPFPRFETFQGDWRNFLTHHIDTYDSRSNEFFDDTTFLLTGTEVDVDGKLVILQKWSPLAYVPPSPLPRQGGMNVALGWPSLHETYWMQGRFLRNGSMNDVFTEFDLDYVKRRREQVEIVMQMCCEDFFDTFRPIDEVRSQLGWGEPGRIIYESPTGRLALKLKHD